MNGVVWLALGLSVLAFFIALWALASSERVGWTDLQDQIWKLRDKLGKVACAEVEASLLRVNANTTYNSKLLALGRALGWRYEEATNCHLARWVPCEGASAAGVVTKSASTGDVLTELHISYPRTGTTGYQTAYGDGFSQFGVTVKQEQSATAPKPKRARGSSTGATRKRGKRRG